MSDPGDVVRSFIAAWNANDLERVLAHLHPEVVYHNVPLAPLHGLPAVRAYLSGIGRFDWVDWKLLALAVDGQKVLTERIDDFKLRGTEVSLPLMGIFEVEGGRIRAWRDYFDLAMYRRQLPAPAAAGTPEDPVATEPSPAPTTTAAHARGATTGAR